jgi:predicted phosphodiesterase
MRVAVISDIHSNLHALEAVLADVDRESVDAVWCLGDLVGYGPQPTRCCELVAARAAVSLAGNHDLGVLGAFDLEAFSEDAAAAARWTRETISAGARRYLAGLKASGETAEAALYHGSPRDPVWEYVLSAEAVLAALEAAPRHLVLVGHSHVPLAFTFGQRLEGGLAPEGTALDLPHLPTLLNPGSVGQPRDGDPRAAWLLLDFGLGRASFRRTPYPIHLTQAEMQAAGLPDALAERLASGT